MPLEDLIKSTAKKGQGRSVSLNCNLCLQCVKTLHVQALCWQDSWIDYCCYDWSMLSQGGWATLLSLCFALCQSLLPAVFYVIHYTTLHCLASLIIFTSIPHLLFLLWLFILHSTDLRVHGTTLYYNSLFHNTALSSNVSVVFPSSSSVPAYYLVLLLSTALPYPGSLGGKEVEGSIGLAHA